VDNNLKNTSDLKNTNELKHTAEAAEDQAQEPAPAAAAPPPTIPRSRPRRRRFSAIAFLIVGLLFAWFLSSQGPQEQHVRIVLGSPAPEVVGLSLQYVSKDGEAARETRFSFPIRTAPRVVAHDFQLPNGDYRLDIEVDIRDGRVRLQRQVTLGGGSTQIDISSAISQTDNPKTETDR
jgi:hypothetical protein